jgi:hypothetical protein
MLLRWLVLVFALAQIAVPILPNFGLGTPVGQSSDAADTPATPAGYAFSIWSVIFALSLAFAIYQLRRPNEPRIDAVRAPLAVAFAANTAWMLWVQSGGIAWASVVIILVGAVAAIFGLLRLRRHEVRTLSWDGAFLLWPAGLLAGWLTVAAFANFGAAARATQFQPFGMSWDAVALVLVAKAGVLAAVVAWLSRGAIPYALAAAWGLVAVMVANGAQHPVSLAAIAALVLVAAATASGARRRAALAP